MVEPEVANFAHRTASVALYWLVCTSEDLTDGSGESGKPRSLIAPAMGALDRKAAVLMLREPARQGHRGSRPNGPNAEQSRVACRSARSSQYSSGMPRRTKELYTGLRSISHWAAMRSFSAQASWRAWYRSQSNGLSAWPGQGAAAKNARARMIGFTAGSPATMAAGAATAIDYCWRFLDAGVWPLA